MPLLWIRMLTMLAACVAMCAAPAGAQIGGLPQDLIRKTGQLTPAETEQVRAFVAPLLSDLGQPDAVVRSRARASLTEPLKTAGVSVAFQQAYSTTVSPSLGPLVVADDGAVRIAAIDVAGTLGTIEGWQLVEPHMADDQPGVRMATAVACRSLLEAAAKRSPAINSSSTSSIIDALGQRLAAEPNPFVADGLVRTLLQGGQLVTVNTFEASGTRAWQALSEHLGTRAFNSRDKDDFAAQQTRLTLLGTLEFFRTAGGLTRPGGVDPAIIDAAASLSAEALAMVAVEAHTKPGTPLSSEMVRMGRMTATVLSLAARQKGVAPPEASLLAPPIDGADPDLFFRDVRTYVLSVAQKFGVPAARVSRWFP